MYILERKKNAVISVIKIEQQQSVMQLNHFSASNDFHHQSGNNLLHITNSATVQWTIQPNCLADYK
jgi:hypothetical protein